MNRKTLAQIWIYPVKSLGGIQLGSAKLLPKGLEHDRRWMLIDSENNFMTQRVYPALCLFKLSFDSGNFVIRHVDDTIELPFHYGNFPISARIWNDRVEVFEVSKQHSEWFSSRLGMQCRLVFFPEKNPRPVDPAYSVNNDQVSLADAFPLLLIGQRSLDDLNQRLEEPLPMNRFRPSIVFDGGIPYEEDEWQEFRIGKNRFAAAKKCARCVVTTVNQDTGQKGAEPLLTLSKYRQKENKVYFGQNLVPLDFGIISVGEEIIFDQ